MPPSKHFLLQNFGQGRKSKSATFEFVNYSISEALSPEEKAKLEELAKAEEAKAAERQRLKEEKKQQAEEELKAKM